MIELVEVVTTVADEESAARLGRDLVERRLAACANVGAIRSIYPWDGAIQDESELQVVFKTTAERAAAAERRLEEIHPYDTPAILRVPILSASADYAEWVRAHVHGENA